MDVDGVGVPHVLPAPDVLIELLPGVDLFGVGQQQRQDLELPGGEGHVLPPGRHPDGLPVQNQVPQPEHLPRLRWGGELPVTAELGLHTGQHLGVVEGLGDEVVGPQPQDVDPVLQSRLGGEDQDGHGLFPPHLGDELLAGQTGEHQIQQHQVVLVLLGPQHGLAAGEGGPHVVAPVGKNAAQQAVDIRIVLHHQDVIGLHAIGSPPPGGPRPPGYRDAVPPPPYRPLRPPRTGRPAR